MKNALGTYWQGLAAIAAVAAGYLGVTQFFTGALTVYNMDTGRSSSVLEVTPGKVVGLVLLVGAGLLVLAGLAVHRKNPRSGALMVIVGLLPMAAVGGFGIGLVVGLLVSLAGGLDWWWAPVAIASAVATVAGVGAFGAWWHASPAVAAAGSRSTILPLVLVGIGLLAAGAGVSLGAFTGPLLVFGAALAMVGAGIWTRHLKTTR